MNKRGQIYILAIIIMAIVIFSVVIEYNKIIEKKENIDFYQLSENYIVEAQKVINNAIESGQDPNQALSDFTTSYINYAKTKDPGIGLVYMVGDDTGLHLENHLPESDTLTYENTDIWSSQDDVLNQISLDIGGRNFTHNVEAKISQFNKEYIRGDFNKDKVVLLDIGGTFYKLKPGDDPYTFTAVLRSLEIGGNDQLQKIKSDEGWE